jgi:Leucine-rich repeat (LRR) protein
MALLEPLMQLPRLTKLDLSHNDLSVLLFSLRTAQ